MQVKRFMISVTICILLKKILNHTKINKAIQHKTCYEEIHLMNSIYKLRRKETSETVRFGSNFKSYQIATLVFY